MRLFLFFILLLCIACKEEAVLPLDLDLIYIRVHNDTGQRLDAVELDFFSTDEATAIYPSLDTGSSSEYQNFSRADGCEYSWKAMVGGQTIAQGGLVCDNSIPFEAGYYTLRIHCLADDCNRQEWLED
ncbi:MAG: hypothetical protein AAF433_10895 [Bacteroidota bacterium]